MKTLEQQLAKLVEDNRLDTIVSSLQNLVGFDDLLLAFSNHCVFKAMDEEKLKDRVNCKEYREWMARAEIFYNAIKDGRKATVLKRKLQIEPEKPIEVKPIEEGAMRQRGERDGREGLNPSSTSQEYLTGYTVGRRARVEESMWE